MEVLFMRTLVITFLMSPFPFTPQLLLHLLRLLSSVNDVALPSLCTPERQNFEQDSFKPITPELHPLCECQHLSQLQAEDLSPQLDQH